VPIGGPIGILFRLFILLAGGFVSVYFYNKRTGETLTVTAGARMGWITGVVFYVIWMVFFTITLILLQSEGGLLKAYQEQLKESAAPQAGVEQLMEIMKSPEMFATMLVVTLGVVFFVFTLSMIAGGALAAKILPRD
jgi:ABC-type sugar transport system permease subunit